MLLGDDLKEEPMGKDKMDRLYERFRASKDSMSSDHKGVSIRQRFRRDKDGNVRQIFISEEESEVVTG